jgi:predicted nucleotide-binding protein (sugar kinase/HSP70/actin superfamily)
MRSLGHEFRMCPINVRRPVEFYRDMKRISPGLSFRAITREMMRLFNGAKELDEAEREVNRSSDIRVGLAGELYVTNESAVNMEVVNKLQQLGVFVDRWLCLSNNVSMLVREMLHISNTSRYGRIARRYFPQRIGGHANENLVKLVRYAEEGYDGAIMLKPFACNPETVIEPIVDRIGRDYDMPILWLSIDESTLETHFETRIESFVDMLRMRKGLS